MNAAELDSVPDAEGMRTIDALTVEIGSIAGTEVNQNPTPVAGGHVAQTQQETMPARHCLVGNAEIGLR